LIVVDDLGPEDVAVHRLIGIGASAGGIEALIRLVRGLPPDLPAAVLVVLHIPATGSSVLPAILARHCPLPVQQAGDGQTLRAGEVLVAPPDCHLRAVDGRVRLERGPKENGVRPAVDPMLRSVAAAAGDRGIAVILSGALGDGADGAATVAAAGGTVLVQDPADAIVPSMPERTLQAVGGAARALRALDIGHELGRLVAGEPAQTQEARAELLGRTRLRTAAGADALELEGEDIAG
jgi:two-component system chemotaxis response regulator CheB